MSGQTPGVVESQPFPRSVVFTTATSGFYGSTRVVLRHAASLCDEGVRVAVMHNGGLQIDGGDLRLTEELRRVGAELIAVPGITTWRVILPWGAQRDAIRRAGPDVLVSTQVRDAASTGLLARLARTPFVALVQNHPNFSGVPLVRWAKGWAYRLALRRADRVICVAEHVGEVLRSDLGIDADRITVIPNVVEPLGAEPARGAAVRRALGVEDDDVLLLNVGRIHRQKGQEVLLDALAGLPAGRRVVLAVAGGVEARGAEALLRLLQERAEANHLEVLWLGFRSDIDDLLAAADLVVSASLWEAGPSLAVLEAMGAGRPVVLTDHGERMAGFEDGVHGFYAAAGSVRSLAERLSEAMSLSRSERSEVGSNARQLIVERARELGQESRFVHELRSLATDWKPAGG